jgi:hypothetical protein
MCDAASGRRSKTRGSFCLSWPGNTPPQTGANTLMASEDTQSALPHLRPAGVSCMKTALLA